MPRYSEIARSIVLVVATTVACSFFACQLTVDLDPLNSGECPRDTKKCSVDGKDTCVALNLPAYGCNSNKCQSCTVLGLQNATAGCNAALQCEHSACNAGFGNCDGIASNGCETSILTTAEHCNGCNRACSTGIDNATPSCVNGSCAPQCRTGFGDCDRMYANGCEADFSKNKDHCGNCTTKCTDTQTCVSGVCTDL